MCSQTQKEYHLSGNPRSPASQKVISRQIDSQIEKARRISNGK